MAFSALRSLCAKEWIGSLHHSTDIRGGGGITEQSPPNPVPKEDHVYTLHQIHLHMIMAIINFFLYDISCCTVEQ